MHWSWRWSAVLVLVGLLDLAVRFMTGFDMVWIVRAEAPLFLGATLALLWLQRHGAAPVRWQRWLQRILVVSLALAGLRATAWAVGLPVRWANILVLAVAAIGAAVVLSRRPAHSTS